MGVGCWGSSVWVACRKEGGVGSSTAYACAEALPAAHMAFLI